MIYQTRGLFHPISKHWEVNQIRYNKSLLTFALSFSEDYSFTLKRKVALKRRKTISLFKNILIRVDGASVFNMRWNTMPRVWYVSFQCLHIKSSLVWCILGVWIMPSSYMWQVLTPDVLACERRRISGRQRGDDRKYVCVCRLLMCLSSFCFRLYQIVKRCRYVLTENTRVGEVQHWKRLPTNQTTGKR